MPLQVSRETIASTELVMCTALQLLTAASTAAAHADTSQVIARPH